MSSADTKAVIEQAIERFEQEVPATRQLKLALRLELRGRGDVQTWRVELPGPRITKDPAADARLDVSLPRSHFNELAKDGRLKHWVEAYELGHLKVSGEAGVVKLLGNVIQRQLTRAR